MVGKSIEEQLRDHLASLMPEPPAKPDVPLKRRDTSVDFSSPLEAARLEKARIETGLVSNDRSAPPPPKHPHIPASPEWVPRVRHRQDLKRRGLPYLGSVRSAEPARRTNHCYNCKATVDSQLHAPCSACTLRNIICPQCGACGCGWSSATTMVASDIDFGDDVESWLVNENGVIVFPGAVADLSADEAAKERRAAYSAYLKSSVWRAKREGALKNAWLRCKECGDQDAGLHVHHVSYARVGGAELPEDLQVLCEDCHYHHHAFARAYMDYLRGRPA